MPQFNYCGKPQKIDGVLGNLKVDKLKAEIRTVILRIKGTRHYQTDLAFTSGELANGSDIYLAPEPKNPHDKNAVSVLSSNQKNLGYISKDISAKYKNLLIEELIHQVKVHSAKRSTDHALFDVRIAVTYTSSSGEHGASIPSSPGAYEISFNPGVAYIGSTENLSRRYKQHLNKLNNASHPNNALQNAFDRHGLEAFSFTVLAYTKTRLDAEKFEHSEISKRLQLGERLYNKTFDGKGVKSSNIDSLRTVSDLSPNLNIGKSEYETHTPDEEAPNDVESEHYKKGTSSEARGGKVKGQPNDYDRASPTHNAEHYEQAYMELVEERAVTALWAKAFALADDHESSQRLYIRYRVEQLIADESNRVKNEPLILVDGSSYLYCAYRALPPLTNSKNLPTGAIKGVISMLRRLQRDYPKSLLVVVFDASGKTFRDDLYPQYKANRPPMPDDLRVQLQPIHRIVDAMGLPLLTIGGVDADDVIGTLALQATAAERPVVVSTGDKDMAQLVNQHITLVNTMNHSVMDSDGVREKFGVPPEHIIDYLALLGDKSDNIPGVPGVGEKTAVALLQGLGGLNSIYEQLDRVAELGFRGAKNTAAKLSEHRELAYLSYQLATIKTDVVLPQNVLQLAQSPVDSEALRRLFDDLEFKAWADEVGAAASDVQSSTAASEEAPALIRPPAAIPVSPAVLDYELITEAARFEHWLDRVKRAKLVAVNTETTGLDCMTADLVGISLALTPGEAAYIPFGHDYLGAPEQLSRDYVLAKLKPILEEPSVYKLGHNLKYDCSVLARHGIDLAGITFDTMLESYVLDSVALRHDMDSLAARYLEVATVKFEDIAGRGKAQLTFNQIALEQAAPYAAENADITLRLHHALAPQVDAIPSIAKLFAEIEMPLVTVLSRIERHGALLDYRLLSERMRELETQSGELDWDLASDLPTYINAHTGRVHASYFQAGAYTGRLSSSNPNLQNIPIKTAQRGLIRQSFVAPLKHKIIAADYSQIELRILAHLSNDSNLLSAFAKGKNIHHSIAAELFDISIDKVTQQQRLSASAISFGLLYGISAYGLGKQLQIGRNEAQGYIDRYFQRYPGVFEYMAQVRESAVERGFVETVFGRRLYLPEIKARNATRRQASERTAISAPIQGTAADIIKLAMISLDQWISNENLSSLITMQVHDEFVLEVPDSEVDLVVLGLKRRMERAAELRVRLVVDVGIGDNWNEAY